MVLRFYIPVVFHTAGYTAYSPHLCSRSTRTAATHSYLPALSAAINTSGPRQEALTALVFFLWSACANTAGWWPASHRSFLLFLQPPQQDLFFSTQLWFFPVSYTAFPPHSLLEATGLLVCVYHRVHICYVLFTASRFSLYLEQHSHDRLLLPHSCRAIQSALSYTDVPNNTWKSVNNDKY